MPYTDATDRKTDRHEGLYIDADNVKNTLHKNRSKPSLKPEAVPLVLLQSYSTTRLVYKRPTTASNYSGGKCIDCNH